MIKRNLLFCLLFATVACNGNIDPAGQPEPEPADKAMEKIILLNEGNMQSDNGQLSYISDHSIENGWFRKANGVKLGDTPLHIIALNDTLLAVTVNGSNTIDFIKTDGKLAASSEDVPNCRYLATDGKYLYVTSYAHNSALKENYTKGYVAKLDLKDYSLVSTCETGYEPEGVAIWQGRLYVANSGGYAFSEGHDYENTITVVDASTMRKISEIEITDNEGVRMCNLFGAVSQSGKYLCINASGDFASLPAGTVLFNCEECTYSVFDFPATYNTVLKNGSFFAVGSVFSYETYSFEYMYKTIDPVSGECFDGYIIEDGSAAPEVVSALKQMESPNGIYQNPYTGHLYITDAGGFTSAGKIYEFDEKGSRIGEPLICYICPSRMTALRPSLK